MQAAAGKQMLHRCWHVKGGGNNFLFNKLLETSLGAAALGSVRLCVVIKPAAQFLDSHWKLSVVLSSGFWAWVEQKALSISREHGGVMNWDDTCGTFELIKAAASHEDYFPPKIHFKMEPSCLFRSMYKPRSCLFVGKQGRRKGQFLAWNCWKPRGCFPG